MGPYTTADALHPLGVYLFWWPADEAVKSPVDKQQLYALVVQLANRRAAATSAAPDPGARNPPGFLPASWQLANQMARRIDAAHAFELVVHECLRLVRPGEG